MVLEWKDIWTFSERRFFILRLSSRRAVFANLMTEWVCVRPHVGARGSRLSTARGTPARGHPSTGRSCVLWRPSACGDGGLVKDAAVCAPVALQHDRTAPHGHTHTHTHTHIFCTARAVWTECVCYPPVSELHRGDDDDGDDAVGAETQTSRELLLLLLSPPPLQMCCVQVLQ